MKRIALVAAVIVALFLVRQFVEAYNANAKRQAREQAFAAERATDIHVTRNILHRFPLNFSTIVEMYSIVLRSVRLFPTIVSLL